MLDGDEDPRLTLIINDGDTKVGSVSIPRSILLDSTDNKKYQMWITLFDDLDDDEYDGVMGIQDKDSPRIQVEIIIYDSNSVQELEPKV